MGGNWLTLSSHVGAAVNEVLSLFNIGTKPSKAPVVLPRKHLILKGKVEETSSKDMQELYHFGADLKPAETR